MRTIEDALKRAESLRDFRKVNPERFERNQDFWDIVNLADEVERLRTDGVTSALDVGAQMGALYKERDGLRQMVTLGSGEIVEAEDSLMCKGNGQHNWSLQKQSCECGELDHD